MELSPDAEGMVAVSFDDYRDPADLQVRLRVAGVRATVRTLPESCYPSEASELRDVTIEWDPALSGTDFYALQRSLFPWVKANRGFVIDPRHLPAGDSIWVGFPPPEAAEAGRFVRIAVYPTATGPRHWCAGHHCATEPRRVQGPMGPSPDACGDEAESCAVRPWNAGPAAPNGVAEGMVAVMYRDDYRDPADLQARLRAAGVRAAVQTLPASSYPGEISGPSDAASGCISWDPSLPGGDRRQVYSLFRPVKYGFAVDPNYLPDGASIWVGFPPPEAAAAGRFYRIVVAPTATGPPRFFSR